MEKPVVYVAPDAHAENQTPEVVTPKVPWILTPGRVPDTFVSYVIDRYLHLTYEMAYNRQYFELLMDSKYWTRAQLADACRREVINIWKASGRESIELVTRGAVEKSKEGSAQAEQDYNDLVKSLKAGA